MTTEPTQMTLTSEQLNDLIEKYCDRVVDEMDPKSMKQMLYALLVDSFQRKSSESDMEQLITAIYDEEYYQELVESVTNDQ